MKKYENLMCFTEIDDILSYFKKKEKILLVLGLGFDPRICESLKKFKQDQIDIDVVLLDYNEKANGEVEEFNKTLLEQNEKAIANILNQNEYKKISIPMYKYEGNSKTVVITESVRRELSDFNGYKEIIIDISAMPRAVSFTVINRIYSCKNDEQKVYILACENSECDYNIETIFPHGSAEYLQGLNTFSLLSSTNETETIWLPILGINDNNAYEIIHDFIKPKEICPSIPFPSFDERRGEKILRNHGESLFRTTEVEKRNIIYIPEDNPLIISEKLYSTVKYYEKALNYKKDNKYKYVFSSNSSKLIDIGVFMAIMRLLDEGIKVGFVIVENQGYSLKKSYDETKNKIHCICLDNNEFDWN